MFIYIYCTFVYVYVHMYVLAYTHGYKHTTNTIILVSLFVRDVIPKMSLYKRETSIKI